MHFQPITGTDDNPDDDTGRVEKGQFFFWGYLHDGIRRIRRLRFADLSFSTTKKIIESVCTNPIPANSLAAFQYCLT